MKLLLTDTSTPLGLALEHELERESFNLLAPTAEEVDWNNLARLEQYLERARPDIVINTLGWKDSPNEDDLKLLVASATNLASAAAPLNLPVIQFSSYRVFGGDNRSSHAELDSTSPTSGAGRAFLQAEQALANLPKSIVLRLSWVLSSRGDNLLTRLLNQMLKVAPVSVNARTRGAPTAISDVARVAVALAKQISCGAENWGIMHYCSGDACSQADFAEQVSHSLVQLDVLESPAKMGALEASPDTEPVSAVLGCERIRDAFGVQVRSWRPSLVPMIKQWLHEEAERGTVNGERGTH